MRAPQRFRRFPSPHSPRLAVSIPTILGFRPKCITSRPSAQAAFQTTTSHCYRRKADHVPNTRATNETHYILALHTDGSHHQTMTSLRKRFFPVHLNKLDAHVAMFRALPGSEMDLLQKDLTSLTATTSAFAIRTRETFRLSKGVVVNVDDGGRSRTIYETLKKSWAGFLSQQDQSYRPHYTVANKLNDEQDVQNCLEGMHSDFAGSEGTVDGLALYRYERGWWVDRKIFWLQGIHK